MAARAVRTGADRRRGDQPLPRAIYRASGCAGALDLRPRRLQVIPLPGCCGPPGQDGPKRWRAFGAVSTTGTGSSAALEASRPAPGKALAAAEAPCDAGTDKDPSAPEPGRYRRTGRCCPGPHQSLPAADWEGGPGVTGAGPPAGLAT